MSHQGSDTSASPACLPAWGRAETGLKSGRKHSLACQPGAHAGKPQSKLQLGRVGMGTWQGSWLLTHPGSLVLDKSKDTADLCSVLTTPSMSRASVM